MNQWNLCQFREFVGNAKSIAMIGNAPEVLQHNNGETIDSCDLVVRFNRAYVLGVENKIGSRTDVLVANVSNNLSMARSPAETLQPRCVVAFVSPYGIRNFSLAPFFEWVGDIPLFITTAPDMVGIRCGFHTRPFTSGTYALYLLLGLAQPEQLFITGFTMFGAAGGQTQKYYADSRRGVGLFHDIDVEARAFADILLSFKGDLKATPEITAVLKKYGHRFCGPRRSGGQRAKMLAWVASGVSWRLLKWGLALRRIAEGQR